MDSLADMGIHVTEVRSLGGGARSRVWNQIKADINQVPLETVTSVEAASLGAAILAGKAVGIFPDITAAVDSMVHVKERTEPDPAQKTVYDRGYAMYCKLFEDLEGCFGQSL